LILIDGKDGLAKGKLRNNEDGNVSCSLFGWKGRHTGQTLKECVDYLRDSIACGWALHVIVTLFANIQKAAVTHCFNWLEYRPTIVGSIYLSV